MIKKIVATLFFLIFLTVITGASSAGATTDEDFANFRDRLSDLRDRREEKLDLLRERNERRIEELRQREAIQERVATRQAEARQRVVERIKKVFAKILKRLEAALTRLDKIAERIATRIDKLKDKGVDTTAAEQQLIEAETAGAAAAQAIVDAGAAIEAIDSESSTVRDAVHAARDAVRGAKRALKNYHKALVEAIRELKAARELREATEDAE
ncbi:MAG: hypothetical protein AAB639_00660 [Patescibacteria group bacterium]